MVPNKALAYGKSASMPMLPSYREGEAEQDYTMQQSWEQVLLEIQRSPEYQLHFPSSTSILIPRHHDAECSPTYASHTNESGRSEPLSSPGSDTTVRATDFSDNVPLTPSRSKIWRRDLKSSASLGAVDGGGSPDYDSVPQLRPYATVFQPSVLLDTRRTSQPSPKVASPRRSRLDQFEFSQGQLAIPDASVLDTHSTKTPVTIREDMFKMKHDDSRGPVQGVTVAQQTLHHQRASSRTTTVLPSPLGPGHFRDDLGSDTSGLVSATHATVPSLQRNIQGSSVPTPSTARMATSTRSSASFQHTTAGHRGFDISDPFVDRTPPSTPSRYIHHSFMHVNLTPATPHNQRSHPQSLKAPTSSSQYDKSIPPLPLPVSQLVRQSDPQARLHLNSQKSIRAAWIRTEASKITKLTRTVFLAKQQYERTRKACDYGVWVDTTNVLLNATNSEKRMEERRNLTLPQGMRALKTGPYSLPCDGAGGQSGLLGFKMALMERICAEGVMKNDACAIPMEEMSNWGKRAVRSAAIRDVEAGIKRRMNKTSST